MLGAVLGGAGVLGLLTASAWAQGGGSLSTEGKDALTAALAAGKSCVQTFSDSNEQKLPCDGVVGFLCQQAGDDASRIYEIVYVAATAKCDIEDIVAAAIQAGAPLQTVVTAARAGGGSEAAISSGALQGGAEAGDIANAMAGIPTTGGAGGAGGSGAHAGSGTASGNGFGTGSGRGDSFGGAGGTSSQASPYKPGN